MTTSLEDEFERTFHDADRKAHDFFMENIASKVAEFIPEEARDKAFDPIVVATLLSGLASRMTTLIVSLLDQHDKILNNLMDDGYGKELRGVMAESIITSEHVSEIAKRMEQAKSETQNEDETDAKATNEDDTTKRPSKWVTENADAA